MAAETETISGQKTLYDNIVWLIPTGNRTMLAKVKGEPQLAAPDYELLQQLAECLAPDGTCHNKIGTHGMVGFGHIQMPIATLVAKTKDVPTQNIPEAIAQAFGFRTFAGLTLAHAVLPQIDEARHFIKRAIPWADYVQHLAEMDLETSTRRGDRWMAAKQRDCIEQRMQDKAIWKHVRGQLNKVQHAFIAYAKKDPYIFNYQIDSIPQDIAKYKSAPHDRDWTPPASALFNALGKFVQNHSPIKIITDGHGKAYSDCHDSFYNFASVLFETTGLGRKPPELPELPKMEEIVVIPPAAAQEARRSDSILHLLPRPGGDPLMRQYFAR